MKRIFPAPLLLLALFPASVFGAFSYLGQSPTAEALGGAYTAGQGLESVFYNPAGLGSISNVALDFRYRNLTQDLPGQQIYTAGGLVALNLKHRITFGFSFERFSAAGLYAEDFATVPLVFSVAGSGKQRFDAGLALKYLNWVSHMADGSSVSPAPIINFDAGFRFIPFKANQSAFAFSLRNILPVKVSTASSTVIETMAMEIMAGAMVVFPPINHGTESPILYIDCGSQLETASLPLFLKLNAGFELPILKGFMRGRAGVSLISGEQGVASLRPTSVSLGLGLTPHFAFETDLSYKLLLNDGAYPGLFALSVKYGFKFEPKFNPPPEARSESSEVNLYFSQAGGVYPGPFILQLSADRSCTIHITMNGTDPTADSFSVRFSDKPVKIKILKSCEVRCMLVDEQGLKSEIYSEQYELSSQAP